MHIFHSTFQWTLGLYAIAVFHSSLVRCATPQSSPCAMACAIFQISFMLISALLIPLCIKKSMHALMGADKLFSNLKSWTRKQVKAQQISSNEWSTQPNEWVMRVWVLLPQWSTQPNEWVMRVWVLLLQWSTQPNEWVMRVWVLLLQWSTQPNKWVMRVRGLLCTGENCNWYKSSAVAQ